jgi:hypothetical protein
MMMVPFGLALFLNITSTLALTPTILKTNYPGDVVVNPRDLGDVTVYAEFWLFTQLTKTMLYRMLVLCMPCTGYFVMSVKTWIL